MLPWLTVAAGLRSQSRRGEERSSRRVLEGNKSQHPFEVGLAKNGDKYNDKTVCLRNVDFLHSGPGPPFATLLWAAEVEDSRGEHL